MSGAVSVGVAVAAIAGAVASEFATFAVIGAVGATVGAIGAVTKSKELTMAGAAIGVVGAVGGIASAAGAFGAGGVFGSGGTIFGGAESVAGAAEGAISGFATGGGPMGPSGGALAGDVFAGAAPAGGYTVDNIANINNMLPGAYEGFGVSGNHLIDVVSGAVEPVMATTAEITSPTATATEAVAGKDPLMTAAAKNEPAISVASSKPETPAVATPAAPVSGQVTAPGPQATTAEKLIYGGGKNASDISIAKTGASSDSVWKDIWGFAKDNKALVGGVIQAGASFLTGATNPLTPVQISAMKATEKANIAAASKYNAEAAILERQRANMSAPIPRATRAPQGRGLINLPQVTGVPA